LRPLEKVIQELEKFDYEVALDLKYLILILLSIFHIIEEQNAGNTKTKAERTI
jgi:hypothetical protein